LDMPGSNLGQGIDYHDQGICGFPSIVQAYDGTETNSVHKCSLWQLQ
jgi:hypothetical protein